jgi:hypothetical protein
MISAVEIGFALSLTAFAAGYVILQSYRLKARPIPVRARRDAQRRRGPHT